MKSLTLLIALVPLVACAPRSQPATASGPKAETAAPSPPSSAAVRDYLRRFHRRIAAEWTVVQRAAARSHPPDHLVNQPDTMAEVEYEIDSAGHRAGLRLVHSSGHHLFDNSALNIMAWINQPPPLPAALGKGRAVLRWRFYRGPRGASPRYATLRFYKAGPAEALQLCLRQADWPCAKRLVQARAADPSVRHAVGDFALGAKSSRIRLQALPLASSHRLVMVLAATHHDRLWRRGLRELAQRKDIAALVQLLQLATRPRGYSYVERRRLPPVHNAGQISQLLRTAHGAGADLPEQLVLRLLTKPRYAELRSQVLSCTRSLKLLRRIGEKRPELAAVTTVQRASTGRDPQAVKAITDALQSSEPQAMLQALTGAPLPRLAPQLARLVKNKHLQPQQRVLAIRAYAALEASPVPLYVALDGPGDAVQVAAIRALARTKSSRAGAAYRLTRLAYYGKGRIAAEALVAIAHLGIERTAKDVLFLAKRLHPSERRLLAPELWRLGAAARPLLQQMSRAPDTVLSQLARASLQRLDRPKASAAADKPGAQSGQSPPGADTPARPALSAMELLDLLQQQ